MINKKKYIYIVIETKVRDLDSRLFLAMHLASKGMTVFIGYKGDINKFINKHMLRNGIYIAKSLTKGNEKKYIELRSKGYEIASIDEESGYTAVDYSKFITSRFSNSTASYADYIFCWGSRDQYEIIKQFPETKEKVFLTGNPRVDLWRQDFSEYDKNSVERLRKQYGKFVLLSSNLALANDTMSYEDRVNSLKKVGYIKSDADLKTFHTEIDMQKKMFRHFVKLIKYLAVEIPSMNFIIRAHPSEFQKPWCNELEKYSNVYVVHKGNISSWVRASVAVLHNGCTTGFQGVISGVKTIAYTPLSMGCEAIDSNIVSIACSKMEGVKAHLIDENRNNSIIEDNKENIILDNLFQNYKITAQTAVDNIYSVLCNHSKLETEQQVSISKCSKLKEYFKLILLQIYLRILRYKRDLIKKPILSLNELKSIQNKLSKLNCNYNKIKIDRHWGGVFSVSNKDSL
jgi:surface carbohydrate biosynthesis protein